MSEWGSYFQGKRVWVTGASSGIGREIAELLGAARVPTVVSARREDRIEELARRHESLHPFPLDLAEFNSIDEKATRVWDLLGGVDILINNAGMSQRFLFAEADPEVLRQLVDVNLTGTMLLTRAVVTRMLAAGGGHIVTVTSLAMRLPTPMRTVYTAVKAGQHGLFDSLRGEVEPKGIAVTLAVPGVVQTEISKQSVTASGEKYGITDRNQAQGMPADQCADAILAGVARKKREFRVGMTPKLRLGVFMRRFLPGLYFRLISRVKVSGT